jgi:hypothetical protein
MKNALPKLAGIALAAALLAPVASASADPVVSGTVNGSPVVDGVTGLLGQGVEVIGAGCTDPGTSQPGYMGEFISPSADPVVADDAFQPYQTATDADGGFDWSVVIPLDNGTGTFYTRWYCSPGPVTSINDPSMLWVGPEMSMQINAPDSGGTANRMSVRVTTSKTGKVTATAKTTKAAPAGPAVALHTDPDALPAVDKINIPGPLAAKLKKRTDAAAKGLAQFDNLFDHFLGLPWSKTTPPATNQEYATAAYGLLTGKLPTTKAIKPFVNELNAGQIKVAVVENIALTAHNSSWWIRKG